MVEIAPQSASQTRKPGRCTKNRHHIWRNNARERRGVPTLLHGIPRKKRNTVDQREYSPSENASLAWSAISLPESR